MGRWDEIAIVVGVYGSMLGCATLVAPPGSGVARWFRALEGPADPGVIAVAIGTLAVLLVSNTWTRRRWLASHLHEPVAIGVTSYRSVARLQGWRWQPLWGRRSLLALAAFLLGAGALALRTAEGNAPFVAAAGVLAGAAWAHSRWGRGVSWFLPLLVLVVVTATITRSVSAAVIPLGLLALCSLIAFTQENGRALRSWDEATRVDEEPRTGE